MIDWKILPKAEHHAHALLSVPFEIYEELAGGSLPRPPKVFSGFEQFSQYLFGTIFPYITQKNLPRLIRAAFEALIEDHVVYAEMSFDLMVPAFVNMSVVDFALLIQEEVRRVSDRVRIIPEIGVNRTLPIQETKKLFDAFLTTGVFGSVDLYDDERVGQIGDFVPLYKEAGEAGLKLKAHAGELCGPDFIKLSVELLDLDEIQHGVRALENPSVVSFLKERGTVLNICPTSNIALGLYPDLSTHPLSKLVEAGLKVTLGTDDRTIFGHSLSEEYAHLEAFGWNSEDLDRIRFTSLSHYLR